MLISKTLIHHLQTSNDKIIIPDKCGKPQVVLLSFAEYKKLTQTPNQVSKKLSLSARLTNAEFLDKINADIQILKQRLEEQKLEDNFLIDEEDDLFNQDLDFNKEIFNESDDEKEYDPEEDRYYLEEI